MLLCNDGHHYQDGHHQITTLFILHKFGSKNSYRTGIWLSKIITQAEHFRPQSCFRYFEIQNGFFPHFPVLVAIQTFPYSVCTVVIFMETVGGIQKAIYFIFVKPDIYKKILFHRRKLKTFQYDIKYSVNGLCMFYTVLSFHYPRGLPPLFRHNERILN